MLCRKLELIPIKNRFLEFLKVVLKVGQRPCTIVHGKLVIHEKWLGENSLFL